MESIAITKFRAACASVLEKVRRTGEPVLITRAGEPVAEIVPVSPPARPEHWLGAFRSSGHGLGRSSSVKLLLDTHIWLWSLLEPEKLTHRVAVELESPKNELADRFIAATAEVYGLTLVTSDTQILSSKTLSLLPNR